MHDEASGTRPAPLRGAAAFVLVSGCCALVYQVVWTRELRLVFGASTPASAAVLAVFMGGIGLGGLLLGRRAETARSPLAFYGALELGVALAAGLSPWTIALARALYLHTGGSQTLGAAGSTLLRLLLSTLVLGVPTFLMGGTLPAMARVATAALDRGRRALGWLYGCNTLGAVLGAALTTFFLLERLGHRKSLLVAALVNALVGLTARARARSLVSTAQEVGPADDASSDDGATPGEREAVAPLPLVLAAAGLVGFAFFLMELVWYRLLAPILGGSTYTFGTVLLLALLGIGAGGLLYGARSRQGADLHGFALTCALEAMLLVLPLALGHPLAVLAAALRPLAVLGFEGLVAGWLLVGGLVVVPPAIVAGYQFPLLVALLGRGRREVARQTGLATATNTVGAIAGALAGGFGLLPWLGAPGAWRATTVLLALLAFVAWVTARRRGGARPAAALLAAAVAVALCVVPGPGVLWREGEIGAGRYNLDVRTPNEMREHVAFLESGLVWEEDGRESAVGLQAYSGYAFTINGKTDGHVRLDAGTQVMAPLVGAMLHPQPRRGLVIGLGTGSSAGWLAAVPSMQRVDVVELEPAVLRVAQACARANRDVLHDPKVHVRIGDGREVLLTGDSRYDLIFSEPSNPYRAGIASLFTREFYRAAAGRLQSGGIFLQWLQAYQVDAQVVASIYTSLTSVFPYVETWYTTNGDLLLVASAAPVRHDLTRVAQRAVQEPYRSALADTWGVVGAEGFYSGLLAGPPFARRLAAAAEDPNVDDRAVVEFGFARDLGDRRLSLADFVAAVRPEEALPPGLPQLSRERLAALRRVRDLFEGIDVPPTRAGATAQAAALAPAGALAFDPTVSYAGVLVQAESHAETGDPRALAEAAALLPGRPVEAHALAARWLHARRRDSEAAVELARALIAYRADPWPWPPLMERAVAEAPAMVHTPEAARALLVAFEQPFAVRMLERQRLRVRSRLADLAGGDACRAAYRAFEPHPRWEEQFLRDRLACYARTHDGLATRARQDLAALLAARPDSLGEILRAGD